LLENHVDRAAEGGRTRHVLAADQHLAGRGLYEAADHAQAGGLAAAARTEQREELARFDPKRDPVDRDDVPKAFLEVDEANLREGGFRETH